MTALREPRTMAESDCPALVRRIVRPAALGRAVELAFVRWQKRTLGPTTAFWRAFGLRIEHADESRVVARGTGTAACIVMAERGEHNRFLGSAFVMSEDTDLQRYVRELGARPLDASRIPGGGRGVALTDPAGNEVWLLQGQQRLPALPDRDPVAHSTNVPGRPLRVNRGVRTPVAPPQVVRLGHFVLVVLDIERVLEWYMRVLGLIVSDCLYLADGSPSVAFTRLNLGAEPADHHTLALAGGLANTHGHSAFEVLDIDAVGQGNQVLRAEGYRHHWGIGRHVLGSQIFDYWLDPDGFEFEHYADGDVFTADYETHYSPGDLGGLWAWGDDVPATMKPRNNLKTLLHVAGLLRRKAITPQRLKLLKQAFAVRARPWL